MHEAFRNLYRAQSAKQKPCNPVASSSNISSDECMFPPMVGDELHCYIKWIQSGKSPDIDDVWAGLIKDGGVLFALLVVAAVHSHASVLLP